MAKAIESDGRIVNKKLIRLGLHGTGWKIESGQYSEARKMLSEHIKWAKRGGEFERLRALMEVKKDLDCLQLSKPIERAA